MTSSTTATSSRVQAATRLHDRLAALLPGGAAHEPRALAELAVLRRGAGRTAGESPAAAGAVLRIIAPGLRDAEGELLAALTTDRIVDDALLVASLVAFARPRVAPRSREDDDGAPQPVYGSFGRDLAVLRRSLPGPASGDGETIVDRLLRAILDAEREDLDPLLRRAFSLMGRRPPEDRTSVHVAALVVQLGAWSSEDRWVQRRWAYDYWSTGRDDNATSATTTTTENDA